MIRTIRLFLMFEAASFTAASLVHSGLLVSGYEHEDASTAEAIIAAVLAAGFMVTFLRRDWTRTAGLAVQGFALFGTLVGLFSIAIGVGPQTVPDLAYHATILAILIWGLVLGIRWRTYQMV